MARIYYHEEKLTGKAVENDVINLQLFDFIFNNIQLPDSNVNEPASHGFVKFKINQRANNPLGTVIENKAGIYFDFNEAVITNSTHHVLGENFVESNLVGLSTQKSNNVRCLGKRF